MPEDPLPKLVQDAYILLGADWREAAKQWAEGGHSSPPVMLTVCNRTEPAARIERYFTGGDAFWRALHAPEKTLRVDSRVLGEAGDGGSAATDKAHQARPKETVVAAGRPPHPHADNEAQKKGNN